MDDETIRHAVERSERIAEVHDAVVAGEADPEQLEAAMKAWVLGSDPPE